MKRAIARTLALACSAAIAPAAAAQIAIGTASGPPEITRLSNLLGEPRSFPGMIQGDVGLRVAIANVVGNRTPDIIVATGPGVPPRVAVFDGEDDAHRFDLTLPPAIAAFQGGLHVAAGDVTGDGRADIVVGTDAGTVSQVLVFDAVTRGIVRTLMPHGPRATIGVRVAAADVTGDGVADIITGTGPGVNPQVRVFDGASSAIIHDFPAYPAPFVGGVYVAGIDLTGDGRAEIITGPGAGGDGHVNIFNPAAPAVPIRRPVAPSGHEYEIPVGGVLVPGDPEPQPLVVIAIIAVLIGLLVPAVHKVPVDGPPMTLWEAPAHYANRQVYVAGMVPPQRRPCDLDFNADGTLNPDDLSDFITCFFEATCPRADFNADGERNPDDLSDYIAAYFGGCP